MLQSLRRLSRADRPRSRALEAAPYPVVPWPIKRTSGISRSPHGKSTLADRILEMTQTVDPRAMRAQVLDSMDLERELGRAVTEAQALRSFVCTTQSVGVRYERHELGSLRRLSVDSNGLRSPGGVLPRRRDLPYAC